MAETILQWLKEFALTFVPLFIVIDPLGNLPFVISFSEDRPRHERNKMIHIAILTATIVGLAFLFLGRFVLKIMGISVGAFAIAGGIILLVLSIKYMTTGRFVDIIKEDASAVVPIGTPLIVGPAAITTLLLLVANFPLYMVLIAFIANMLISWFIFLLQNPIMRLSGEGGLRALSRVFSLLLAAIAVSMILNGLELAGIIKS
jgi:multiple antibiotic resistance protein